MWTAISAALGIAGKIAESLFPNEEDRAAATAKVIDAMTKVDMGQLELNKVEAAHRSIYVAGWRPFIGWTCAATLAVNFALFPIVSWVFVATNVELPPLPNFDPVLWELMAGMLGIAGLRTFEKYKGVTK